MSNPIYLAYSQGDGRFFDPLTGVLIEAVLLKRNDASMLRVQTVLNRDATISTSTYQASTHTIDQSSYSSTPVFGLKTAAAADADGDYSEVWSGFSTSDTFYTLASSRFAIQIAPTITPATYVGEFQLATSGGSAWSIPYHRTYFVLERDVAIGDETSAPSGITTNSGTATILVGTKYIDVSITDLTVATGAAVVSLKATSTFTQVTYSIPSAGTLRIHSSANAPAGGWSVGYLVTAL